MWSGAALVLLVELQVELKGPGVGAGQRTGSAPAPKPRLEIEGVAEPHNATHHFAFFFIDFTRLVLVCTWCGVTLSVSRMLQCAVHSLSDLSGAKLLSRLNR